jgi:hypothetical protein
LTLEMTPDAIPDLDALTGKVMDFLDFIDTPQMMKLEGDDNTKFRQLINAKYDDMPHSIVKIFLDRENRIENLERLLSTFEMLDTIKKGNKDMESEFDTFREGLFHRYLYPQFGGKEEFARKMATKPKNK